MQSPCDEYINKCDDVIFVQESQLGAWKLRCEVKKRMQNVVKMTTPVAICATGYDCPASLPNCRVSMPLKLLADAPDSTDDHYSTTSSITD